MAKVLSLHQAQATDRGMARNPGMPFSAELFTSLRINRSAVERRAASLPARRSVKKDHQVAWLLKAISCMDLTTLAGDDTPGRVRRLCAKARRPVRADRSGHGGCRTKGPTGTGSQRALHRLSGRYRHLQRGGQQLGATDTHTTLFNLSDGKGWSASLGQWRLWHIYWSVTSAGLRRPGLPTQLRINVVLAAAYD